MRKVTKFATSSKSIVSTSSLTFWHFSHQFRKLVLDVLKMTRKSQIFAQVGEKINFKIILKIIF